MVVDHSLAEMAEKRKTGFRTMQTARRVTNGRKPRLDVKRRATAGVIADNGLARRTGDPRFEGTGPVDSRIADAIIPLYDIELLLPLYLTPLSFLTLTFLLETRFCSTANFVTREAGYETYRWSARLAPSTRRNETGGSSP